MPLSGDPSKRERQIANLRRAPSDDPIKRDRQLANLRPAPPAPPAPPGNARALVHGGRSELLLANVEREIAELAAALGDAAPVRDPETGALPGADVLAVEACARALKRYRSLSAWLDAHGRLVERDGSVKPAAELELKAERQLTDALDRLGMSPMSRSRLGLNLARTQRAFEDDVAAAGRAAWERREAIDGTVGDDGDGDHHHHRDGDDGDGGTA